MFGYIVINKGDMKFKEFDIYHSYYCGLCQTLKERYGRAGQISLSFDMTFLVMLLSSLYEPDTKMDTVRCMAHPFGLHLVRQNEFSAYAADMNVLFTYYKCLDDWKDEKKASRLVYSKLLEGAYQKICAQYGKKARKIDSFLSELSREEKRGNQDLDRMAGLFGAIMGEIMAVKEDEWQNSLRILGNYLGKYIYLMDAYEDIEADLKKGRYNTFQKRYENPDFEEETKTILTMMMAECCKEFEKLPIIENIDILRNILYSGIWYKYEIIRRKREKKQQEEEENTNA